jgi:Uma2 family endonuclease
MALCAKALNFLAVDAPQGGICVIDYCEENMVVCDTPEIEWIGGCPVAKVSPRRRHGLLQSRLLTAIAHAAGSRGDTLPEWRFHLIDSPEGRTTLVPDVAFVSYDRLRALSDEEAEEPPFAPDIAVEVHSPSDREKNIIAKAELYLRNGSTLVLDIDPDIPCIHAYTKSESTQEFKKEQFHPGETLTHPAIPWLQIDTTQLFANLNIPR